MNFLDYLLPVDVRTSLMDRMMQKMGVSRPSRTIPDHTAVTNRAANRCRSCGHQAECSTWLDSHEQAEAPPDYCCNADLIARLQHADGLR